MSEQSYEITENPPFVPPLPPGPAPLAAIPAPPKSPPPSIPPAPAPQMPQIRPMGSMRETRLDAAGRPNWANLELFTNMGLSAIESLRDAMTPVVFQPGDILMSQGDAGDCMYLLDSGSVRISARMSLSDTNFERHMAAPAIVGEMALVARAPRTATVVAEAVTRCLRLSAEQFSQLVERNRYVAEFLTRAVGERLLESGAIHHVGKYQVLGRLGAGAAATVFEAIHPGLQASVALKMLSHGLVHTKEFTDQFRREAQLVAGLNHDHVVRVLDTEEAYGTHFIVMEKLTGLTLDQLIRNETRQAWGAIRRILREISGALAYSHERGLLHRDIKPSNVFLTEEDRRVKLLDFGIAVLADASAHTSGHLLGTPYYMSPEQIAGRKLDGRSDLYSLGILAYELITFQVPFDADNIEDLMYKHLNAPTPDPRLLVPDTPADIVEFILRATAKRPAERFGSCAEAVAFLQLASDLPVVHRIELSTVAISYHPSRRQLVSEALDELRQRLGGLDGVTLLDAHQRSRTLPDPDPA